MKYGVFGSAKGGYVGEGQGGRDVRVYEGRLKPGDRDWLLRTLIEITKCVFHFLRTLKGPRYDGPSGFFYFVFDEDV